MGHCCSRPANNHGCLKVGNATSQEMGRETDHIIARRMQPDAQSRTIHNQCVNPSYNHVHDLARVGFGGRVAALRIVGGKLIRNLVVVGGGNNGLEVGLVSPAPLSPLGSVVPACQTMDALAIGTRSSNGTGRNGQRKAGIRHTTRMYPTQHSGHWRRAKPEESLEHVPSTTPDHSHPACGAVVSRTQRVR